MALIQDCANFAWRADQRFTLLALNLPITDSPMLPAPPETEALPTCVSTLKDTYWNSNETKT